MPIPAAHITAIIFDMVWSILKVLRMTYHTTAKP
jgi:hypothetical protein